MDKWTHPLEPPTIKWLRTAVTLATILLVLQLEPVTLMGRGALLHLSVNVSIIYCSLNFLTKILYHLSTVTLLFVKTVFNNSEVTISHNGEGASALTCHTELTTCCREQDNPSGGALGEWIGPDSNQIPESSSTSGFFVTRQQSSISLNIESNNSVGGQYCCVIPRTEGEMTLCVQVYGEHNYVVHSLIKANSVLLKLIFMSKNN